MPEINDLMEVDAMLAERVKAWTYEWKQEGVQEGIQKGRQEGEAGILLRQMRLKFGELDVGIFNKIQSANTKQLATWSERILSAKTIEEMFQT